MRGGRRTRSRARVRQVEELRVTRDHCGRALQGQAGGCEDEGLARLRDTVGEIAGVGGRRDRDRYVAGEVGRKGNEIATGVVVTGENEYPDVLAGEGTTAEVLVALVRVEILGRGRDV